MTEAEWATCDRPTGMLLLIREQVSVRKVMLFNCACCRRIWDSLGAEDKKTTRQAEESVEDPTAIQELQRRLKPEQDAALAIAGFPNRSRPVKKELAQLLSSQTSLRLGLVGTGYAIGILAYDAARLLGSSRSESFRQTVQSLEERAQAELVREIFGNPFRPQTVDSHWVTPTVFGIAKASYDDGVFDRMPILADALEDAGCDNRDILNHLRSPGPHVRGCRAMDLILGRE